MADLELPKRVFHLAEEANWPSIRRSGLLSASELIKAAGIGDAARRRLVRTQRTAHTELPSGVQIRDQCPMPAAALERCLLGMTAAEWYATINSRVFFWLDPERLNRQRRACMRRPQVVLAVDTASLVEAHASRIDVTPFNTGSARRKPARRGAATFVPVRAWMRSGWESEAVALGGRPRKKSHMPAELTVKRAVPDVLRCLVGIYPLRAGEVFDAGEEPA